MLNPVHSVKSMMHPLTEEMKLDTCWDSLAAPKIICSDLSALVIPKWEQKVEIPSFPLYKGIQVTFLMASKKIGDDHFTYPANRFSVGMRLECRIDVWNVTKAWKISETHSIRYLLEINLDDGMIDCFFWRVNRKNLEIPSRQKKRLSETLKHCR
jgi:hypothetical protein